MHKILWFDDKCNEFPDLPKIFALHDLELISCETSEKFLHELNADSDNQFVAVILDYLDANTTPKSYAECHYRSSEKGLPIFTYSAQQAMIEENDLFIAMIGRKRLYDKGSREERNRLIADIESVIASKEKNSIYVKEIHKCLFNAISVVNDSNLEKYVLKFLRSYIFQEDRGLRPKPEELRQIYEPLFAFLYQKGLLPKECFSDNGKANLTDIQRYLKGESTHYRFGNKCAIGVIDTKGPVLPKELANELEEIVTAANYYSHTKSTNAVIPLIAQSQFEVIHEYLLQKLFIELCGIIIYLVHYSTAENQQSPQKNRTRCFRYEEYTIEEDEQGITHLGSCLLEVPGQNPNKYNLIRNTDKATSKKYPIKLVLKN